MNRHKLMIFREEDAGGAGGSASRGVAAFENGDAGGQQQHQQQQQQQTQQQQEPPKTTVDAEALAQKFGEQLKGVLDNQQQQQQKELTPEEARQLLKYPVIDEDFLKQFGNIETQKAALEKFVEMILTHVHTVNGMTRREIEEGFEGKFKPINEYVTKAQQRERDTDFAKAYPTLAQPALKPLVEAVRKGLEGEKFENEKAHFDAVAKGVEAVIKVQNPNFKLSDGSSPSNKQKDQPNGGIAVTTNGSGGGGGGGEGNQPAKKRGVAIFD